MLYIIANTQYELTQRILSEISTSEVKIIDRQNILKYKSKVLKKIGALFFLLHFPFSYRFRFSSKFIKKIKEIKINDSILFWDIYSLTFLKWACSVCKSRNIKVFLWNSLGMNRSLKENRWIKRIEKLKKRIEFLTFDSLDAKKYGFKITNQICYDPDRYFVETKHLKDTDVYFVGLDKGRYEILNSIYENITSLGFYCDFNIVRDKFSPIKINPCFGLSSLTFEDNIAHITKAKALLEIVKENQAGLTMRTLESLCFHKKLITNNKSIENCEFYSPKNIFILGKDKDMEAFLQGDFDTSIKFDKSNYLIDAWLDKNLRIVDSNDLPIQQKKSMEQD